MRETRVQRIEPHGYLKLRSQKKRKVERRQLPAPKKRFFHLAKAEWRNEQIELRYLVGVLIIN